MSDTRVQGMLKQSNIVIYLLLLSVKTVKNSKKNISFKGNLYHNFKPKEVGEVQKLYQDTAWVDMILNEHKLYLFIDNFYLLEWKISTSNNCYDERQIYSSLLFSIKLSIRPKHINSF